MKTVGNKYFALRDVYTGMYPYYTYSGGNQFTHYLEIHRPALKDFPFTFLSFAETTEKRRGP
jgi:hypothetical protein